MHLGMWWVLSSGGREEATQRTGTRSQDTSPCVHGIPLGVAQTIFFLVEGQKLVIGGQ